MNTEREILPKGVLAVSDYIGMLNEHLRAVPAMIIGEISQTTISSKGHVYFSLKDKHNTGVLNCVAWRSTYDMYGIDVKEGMEIIVAGYPNVYAARGDMKFIVSSLELFGEGALKKGYELLKKKLEAEGLFSAERKRALPEFPHAIGVISSREGAVIHDFVNNLGKHGFAITFVHAQVEGRECVPSLLDAIKTLGKQPIEALVVIRGGGSLESLQGFNNETLLREIARFPVPVIAGIGHHEDVPLVSLVADSMVSTPTAAAHLLGRSWDDVNIRIEKYRRSIIDRFGAELYDGMANFERRFVSLPDRFLSILEQTKQQLLLTGKTILLNDPVRQLTLGYSITRLRGRIVRKRADVADGDMLEIQVSDGNINSFASHEENSRT